MKTVVFDFDKIHSLKTFYRICKIQLQLPEYFGENLDALWDCVTTEVEWPMTIIFKNLTAFHKKKFSKQVELFKDAAAESDNQLQFIMEDADDNDTG